MMDGRILESDLLSIKIGDKLAPIELSETKVRVKNLDVIGDFTVAGQDDNLLDRVGTNTYLKNIGDNFGMGTTTPTSSAGLSQFLEISGEGASGLILTDTTSSTPASYEIWTDANRLRFWDDTYGDVLTLNAGNVGIGTTSPGEKLHVSGGDFLLDYQRGVVLKDSGNTKRAVFRIATGSDLYINTAEAGDVVINPTGSQNVGIGTTSPETILHIVGSGDPYLRLQRSGYDHFDIVRHAGADYLAFSSEDTGGIMVMLDNGNIGVGTYTPSVELEVDGDIKCDDINVQYDYIHAGFNYSDSAGTFVAIPLRAGTRPFTTFVGNLEKCCIIAPKSGILDSISFRSEEVAGNPVVIGFHKASNGTEVPSDTPTVSISADMSAVADDTTTIFSFTSSNTFSRGDVLGFSIDPANDIDDCLVVITLKYDTMA